MTLRLAVLSAILCGPPVTATAAPPEGGPFVPDSTLRPDVAVEPFVPAQPQTEADAKATAATQSYVLGLMYQDRGQLPAAVTAFESALANDPGHLPSLKELTRLHFRMDQPDRAMEYARRVLDRDEGDGEIQYLFGMQSVQNGDNRVAIDALAAAVADPTFRKNGGRLLTARLQLAKLYVAVGKASEAADSIRQALAMLRQPDAYDVSAFEARQYRRQIQQFHQLLALALMQSGDAAGAADALRTGLDEVPPRSRPALRLLLAQALAVQGRWQQVEDELERFFESKTPDLKAYRLYEKALAEQGERDRFLPMVQSWLAADPQNASLRIFLAEKLVDAGQSEKARQVLTKLEDEDAAQPVMARLYRQEGEADKLLDSLARSLALRNTAALQQELTTIAKDLPLADKIYEAARKPVGDEDERFRRYLVSAQLADLTGQADVAKEFLQRSIELRPALSVTHRMLVATMWDARRWQEVVDACDIAMEEVPGDNDLFREWKARALAADGKTERAVEMVKELIDRTRDRDELLGYHQLLVTAYAAGEDLEKAAEVSRETIEKFSDMQQVGFVKYRYAAILSELGRDQEAEALYLALIEDEDSLPQVRTGAKNDLGYHWAEDGRNLERAERLIRDAVEAEPDNSAYLDSLGWVLFKRGDFAEAAKYLKQSVEAEGGDDAVLWDHLGDAYRQLGKKEDAVEAYSRALQKFVEEPERDTDGKKALTEKKLAELKAAAELPEPASQDGP